MLKAKADNLLIFGISGENVKRLKEGQPILVDLEEMNLEGSERLLIFYAETEDDLVKKVTPFITKETKIHESQ